jgi:hypothetical protein
MNKQQTTDNDELQRHWQQAQQWLEYNHIPSLSQKEVRALVKKTSLSRKKNFLHTISQQAYRSLHLLSEMRVLAVAVSVCAVMIGCALLWQWLALRSASGIAIDIRYASGTTHHKANAPTYEMPPYTIRYNAATSQLTPRQRSSQHQNVAKQQIFHRQSPAETTQQTNNTKYMMIAYLECPSQVLHGELYQEFNLLTGRWELTMQ